MNTDLQDMVLHSSVLRIHALAGDTHRNLRDKTRLKLILAFTEMMRTLAPGTEDDTWCKTYQIHLPQFRYPFDKDYLTAAVWHYVYDLVHEHPRSLDYYLDHYRIR